MNLDTINISIPAQELILIKNNKIVKTYAISTAFKGAGEMKNSFQTPRGMHYIRAKIGARLDPYAVFKGRRFTGEILTQEMYISNPDRDWILGRILWLSGLEKGVNRLGEVDTMQRYIYIHGTPDQEPMSIPKSHGCIRMRVQDIAELFNKIEVGCHVWIA
ncbi:MAG: L,D-transpeptidase [Pseudomonadota bacterium]